MDLHVVWHKPITLRKPRRDVKLIYTVDLERVPEAPGVYIFGRQFGRKFSPLYIGKATNLRKRVKQQLNAVSLMRGIEEADIGRRSVLVGEFEGKQGQRPDRCVGLIEGALIRHFLSEGHDLLNIIGKKINTKHTLKSRHVVGWFVPGRIRF